MVSDSEKADYEADTFEDAQSTHDSETPASQSGTRSLTDRRPSSSGSPLTTPKATEHPQLSPDSPEDKKDEKSDDEDADGSDNHNEEPSSPVSQPEDQTPRKPKKSPLLTAHRLSTTSLDEVNLAGPKDDEEGDASLEKSVTSPDSQPEGPPALPSRDEPKQPSRLQGLSASLPSVPWGPPPVNKNLPPNPPQSSAAPPRKITSPFTWLSRASTGAREKVSPGPPTSRRNTAASVSTVGSNPELAGRFHEDGETGSLDSRKQLRNSLKDQFKLLRMRDEGVSAVSDDQASVASGPEGSRASGVVSPTSIAEEQEGNDSAAPLPSPAATSPLPSTVNPNLAPGTVAGISSSATDASAPVDWELWQQLVNQGPEALSGSNIELNAAIKRGIPQTIRGVIWQILADSRNLDLEEVYRELSARGTEKDRDRYWSMSSAVTINGHANGSPGEKEKESLTSSRSSIRSETSTAATSSNHGIISPSSSSDNKDPEAVATAQAALEGVRKKKAKEDAIALQKLEKAIRRDLGSRTSYSKYFLSQRNQEALFGLCKAYALYDEGVGYAQGMNFIAMPLLFNLDEGEAFTLLVKLMNKYGLRNMFIQDMPGLHLHLYQFDRLLEDLEPALACHLRRRGVPPQLYATQWFLTLFAYRFPLQLVLRIYDLIFEEGVESTILRFAVSIMLRNAETLLEMNDMTALTTFLKEKIFDVYIDNQPSANSILESGFFGSSGPSDKEVYRADLMVQDACAIKLTPEMIKTYTTEWEEKTRAEKEQATELEGLKHTVSAQSARIRALEEHAEKSDTEHVQLASELVRLKVENEELKDMNDSYKVQVQELKGVIDRQPGEVEEKLRTEMDRIMKRNIEVQNENRAMEEQTAEMEKDLVETKMKWAELSENHENLKQKWADLRRALD